MRTFFFAILALFICESAIAHTNYDRLPGKINYKILSFVNEKDEIAGIINDICIIQARIVKTNSGDLIVRDAAGVLTNAEKQKLAINLGFSDYNALSNSFRKTGESILDLKDKIRTDMQSINNRCLRQFLTAFIGCLRTATSLATLENCVRQAYAQLQACIAED